MDADRKKLNQILPSHPITLHHKSPPQPLIQGCYDAQALACGIWCVREHVCVLEVCVCLHTIVGRRERETGNEREREGKDDLGVMRAGKIMVPSGIMGLNLIC